MTMYVQNIRIIKEETITLLSQIAFHLILIMTTQKMKRNGLNQVMSLGDFLMSSSLFIIRETT